MKRSAKKGGKGKGKKGGGGGGASVPIPTSDSAAPDAYNQETRDIILSLDHVDKKSQDGSYILKDVSLGMYMGAKIGILGRNGAGKSTVMRILAGQDKEFLGNLHMDPDIQIGYLPQEPVLEEETVIANLEPAVQQVKDMIKDFEEVSVKMAEPDADIDQLMVDMEKLQSKIDAVGGWEIDAKLDQAVSDPKLYWDFALHFETCFCDIRSFDSFDLCDHFPTSHTQLFSQTSLLTVTYSFFQKTKTSKLPIQSIFPSVFQKPWRPWRPFAALRAMRRWPR